MIAGLTYLGVIHTLISLVALASGIISLIRYQEISYKNQIGKTYIITTILTCLTGFGIFQHGGFGKPIRRNRYLLCSFSCWRNLASNQFEEKD